MILPMMGFTFGLMLLGGLAVTLALINRYSPPLRPRPLVPFVGFICLFAGLGAFSLSLGLGALGGALFGYSHAASGAGFFGGYVLGGICGAALGFWKAINFR